MRSAFHTSTVVVLLALTVFQGCGPRRDKNHSVFKQESRDYVLNIAVSEKTAKNPKAGEFILRALDRFFQDRIGTNDLVMITRIEGKRVLAWMGTPRQLRQEFPNPEAFQRSVLNSDRELGTLNDGLVRSLNMLLDTVGNGNAKPVTIVASDMIDTQATSESDGRFIDTLINYCRKNGQIGFFFCDELRMEDIRAKTKKAGFEWVSILPDPCGRPGLPSFD